MGYYDNKGWRSMTWAPPGDDPFLLCFKHSEDNRPEVRVITADELHIFEEQTICLGWMLIPELPNEEVKDRP